MSRQSQTVVSAPLGEHALNLAAISAALAAGPDADPDPDRRWIASVTAGIGYVLFGLGAGLATALVLLSPPVLVEAVARLALLGALVSAVGRGGRRAGGDHVRGHDVRGQPVRGGVGVLGTGRRRADAVRLAVPVAAAGGGIGIGCGAYVGCGAWIGRGADRLGARRARLARRLMSSELDSGLSGQ